MRRRRKYGAPAPRPKARRRRAKIPPEKRDVAGYRQVWRVVDGAVADAINSHPEFFPKPGDARRSTVKRVAGAIIGYLAQAGWGRSGQQPGG